MKRPNPRKWFPPLALIVPALLSGALLAASFQPFSWTWLVFVALVPITVALCRKSYSLGDSFRTGYFFGFVFFVGHMWWMLKLVPASSITFPWLMVPALLLTAAYLGLWPGLFFMALRWLARRSIPALLLAGPALWTLVELFRSRGELGFIWAALGYALVPQPMMTQSASWVGVFGLSWFVVFINMLLVAAALIRGLRQRAVYVGIAGVLLLIVAVQGTRNIEAFERVPMVNPARVAVVQPDVDLFVKWKPEFEDSTLRLIERLTRQSAALGAVLAVFPETSAPVYINHNRQYKPTLSALAVELNIGIYIGFLDGRRDETDPQKMNVYNSSGLFTPQGTLLQYDKMHLLPFGESVPWAWKYSSFSKLDFGQANFLPGRDGQLIDSPAGRLAPLICFESIFPDGPRFATRDGGQILLNITNDGWFGDSPGSYQHAEMAILRAVENRRYLLRSANTGISMVVDPVGRIVSSLGLYEHGILLESVEARDDISWYARMGDVPVILISIALAVAGALVARLTRVLPDE